MKTTMLLVLATLFSVVHAADKPVMSSKNDKDIKWGPCPELFPKGCQIGVLSGDPKKPNADVYLKVPGNYTIPAHTHTSPEHMTLVSGNLNVKYKDEEMLEAKPGNYLYGPAEHPHEAKCVSKEDCVLFISFDNPVDAKAYTGKL